MSHPVRVKYVCVVLCLLVFAAIAGRWWGLTHRPASHGLYGAYYSNPEWRGEPWRKNILDTDISHHAPTFIEADSQSPNRQFSVEWRGYIEIPEDSFRKFFLLSDDGSQLWIDHRLVVDNGGMHGLQEVRGKTVIAAGVHTIRIRYVQMGGSAVLRVFWEKWTDQKTLLTAENLFPPTLANRLHYTYLPFFMIAVKILIAGIVIYLVYVLLPFVTLPQKKLAARYMLIFIGCYIAGRVLFFMLPLTYEEGIFGAISIYHPVKPNYCQIARINGETIYDILWHPSLMLELLSYMGYGINFLLTHILSQAYQPIVLRCSYALFQLAIWLGLIIICMKKLPMFTPPTIHRALLLLLFMLSPVAVRSSVNLHMDGSVGVFSCGAICLVLLVYQYQLMRLPVIYLLAAVASIFFGFGKQEWNLAFLVSVVCATGYVMLLNIRRLKEHLSDIFLSMILIMGVLIGNVISYYFDPVNYLSGLHLFYGASRGRTILTAFSQWLHISAITQWWIVTHLVLFLLLGIGIFKKRCRLTLPESLIVLFSLSLFTGYLLSSWSEIRYYSTGFITAVSGYIIFAPWIDRVLSRKMAMVCVIILAIHPIILEEWYLKRLYLPNDPIAQCIQENANKECVPWIAIAVAYDQKLDYVAASISRETVDSLMKKYGKVLCK